MSNIYKSAEELIGRTPLVELSNVEKDCSLSSTLLCKLEYFNPAGSVKDRAAKFMIDDAEKKGLITKDTVIIEPTSGNTGIGLCSVAAARGYRVMIVMPDSMSLERRMLMTAYGAELVLTDGALGMSGAIEKAEELHRSIPDSIIAGQFVNPANPEAHYKTTGPEIWEDTDGKVDIFVCGVGTGGTITGVGRYLKEKNHSIKIVAVEPADSPLISEGRSGAHKIQGIGANFIPETFDRSVCDDIVTVTTEEAYAACRMFGRREGILVGVSSGAALHAAIKIASAEQNKTVVALLPDTGERYLSSGLFE
ncbi:MAG: cysteine synthase A [Clostridia bacterium]|nr:cysteine synthase A [Clostridia bacterium]